MYNEIEKDPENITQFEEYEKSVCDCCFEPLIFCLKDSKGNKFDVGLTSVMEMLEAAVKEGVLPKLPDSWTYKVESLLRIHFDEGFSYYDNKE